MATARAYDMLKLDVCDEAAKPEWWNDKELKALSARVVRAAPNEAQANTMRAMVFGGGFGAWEAGPRSAAEFMEAAAHFDRSAALSRAPTVKADFARMAVACRTQAGAM